jgi:hypothetical protein
VALATALMRRIEHARVKIRILLSLGQVLSTMRDVLGNAVRWPDLYGEASEIFGVFTLDLKAILPFTPFVCMLPEGIEMYYLRLLLTTAGYAALILGLAGFSALTRGFLRYCALQEGDGKSKGGGASKRSVGETFRRLGERLGERSLDLCFFILFLIYPSCSAQLFSYFGCQCFNGEGEDGRCFLIVDPSIQCYTTSYNVFRIYVFCMLLLYPVGVPSLYAWMFWKNRQTLRSLQRKELRTSAKRELTRRASSFSHGHFSDVVDAVKAKTGHEQDMLTLKADMEEMRKVLPSHVQKLIDGYDMRCYWFEIVECVRKLLLVGVTNFFTPGSDRQLLFSLLVAFSSFGFYARVMPYEDGDNDLLSMTCQVQIFLSIASKIVLRLSPGDPIITGFLLALLGLTGLLVFINDSESQALFGALRRWCCRLPSGWCTRTGAMAGGEGGGEGGGGEAKPHKPQASHDPQSDEAHDRGVIGMQQLLGKRSGNPTCRTPESQRNLKPFSPAAAPVMSAPILGHQAGGENEPDVECDAGGGSGGAPVAAVMVMGMDAAGDDIGARDQVELVGLSPRAGAEVDEEEEVELPLQYL